LRPTSAAAAPAALAEPDPPPVTLSGPRLALVEAIAARQRSQAAVDAAQRPVAVSASLAADAAGAEVELARLQALLHDGRLKIHRDLAEAAELVRELSDFRVEYTPSGSITFNARVGRHDDLVLALAIACWRAYGSGPSDGFYQLVRAQAAALRGLAEPIRTVVGVDLGQSRDPSAIAIVQRVPLSRIEERPGRLRHEPPAGTEWLPQ
jgi:hypothetical protein